MRILFILDMLDPGGTEHQALKLIQRLTQRGHSCCVAALNGGILEKEFRNSCQRVEIVARRFRHDLRPTLTISRIVKEERIQIVHSWHWLSNVYARLIAIRHRALIVITSERGFIDTRSLLGKARRFLDWLLFPLSTCRVTNSIILQNHLIDLGYSKSRIQVVHNGLELESFANPPSRSQARVLLGLKEGDNSPLIGIIGRLEPVKDHATFINASKIVLARFPEALFLIIGTGSLEAALKQRIERLELESKIKLCGYIPNLAKYLPGLDIVVQCSLKESSPNALLEAMAAKCLVIGSRVGGIPELINDGESGFLVPAQDSNALAERIIYALKNPRMARELAACAQNHAWKYDIDNMATTFEELYQKLLNQK